jgi:hypothetical protein
MVVERREIRTASRCQHPDAFQHARDVTRGDTAAEPARSRAAGIIANASATQHAIHRFP